MKIARKDHSCHWCGETIASGNEFELFQTNIANPRGGFKVVRHRYHPECRTPKDQATLHGIGEIEGRHVRGEFPCPNDTDGDGIVNCVATHRTVGWQGEKISRLLFAID